MRGRILNLIRDCDDKTWCGLIRTLNVWEERNIYDKQQVAEWRKVIGTRKVNEADLKPSSKAKVVAGKHKRDKEREMVAKKKKPNPPPPQMAPKFTVEPVAAREGVIVEPNVLIKALKDLENSASTDSSVRDKIASFPPEVTDPSLLDKIRDKDQAEKLHRQVEMARGLLIEYNSRLVRELEDRTNVQAMMATYAKNQKDLLSLAEQKLAEYKSKLDKVMKVRADLKSHLQNLPDLSRLPSVGLAPLPSAGDLFNIDSTGHRYTSSMGSTSSASPTTASPADYDYTSTPNSGS